MTLAQNIIKKLNKDNTETIRAVIYARVSTDNEGQKESCANQVELAMNYISEHPNIELVGTYVDDGISGKNDFTRPQYNEMLQNLSIDGFDLIITKALSRLNRNELNSLMLNSMLLDHNATVLTLEDGQVQDFEDVNSGLLHSIKYAMDAQFVKQQSINGRKTHELRCQRKELSAKDCSYGYDWHRDTKTITINIEQAEIVNKIFEDYVYRNGTPSNIQKKLKSEGINFSTKTITNIIQNERYIGNFYINKRTTKLGTGQTKSKRIKLPKEQWVLCERPDLQIIDDDLFDLAQRIHKSRITIYDKPDKKAVQDRFRGKHLFASKIFCPVCGKPYQFGYSDRKKTLPIYQIKSHSDCANPIRRIYEKDIVEITKLALKETLAKQDEVYHSLEKVLTEIVKSSQNNSNQINQLKKQRNTFEKKLDNLIDQLAEGGLTENSKNKIKEKINTITEDINRLTDEINDKENCKLDDSYVSNKLDEIKKSINNLRNFNKIDRDRILNYIERIDMPPSGDIEILLKSGQKIITKQKNNTNFSENDFVGKKVIRDVSDSQLANTYNKVFLASFRFKKSIHSRKSPNQSIEVTVNCYLRTEQEGWL